ncbi:hypothetical protein COLO4_15891 [Corchorus olitorius]|uniref:C2H2-type domain-containing protein n=1 Tax=Corchorus olitorius TaxID=93759 RepID=A0A1R3JKR1_9ROSI|nr:hypothetical protein COLO4_15891 [Corchorus olitorius]
MAGLGNGLNSISHANIMHGLNLIKEEPFTDGPIACRVCGHVFLNNAALFDHIEIHLVIDEEDARRKVLLSHMTPSQRALFTTLVDQPTAAGNGGGDHDMQSPSATAPPSPTSGGATGA